MFVEFTNDLIAQDAQSKLDGYALDKNHTFRTNLLRDFDRYQELDSSPKVDTPVAYKDPGNLWWWLTKNDLFDQFAILYGDPLHISVFSNTPTQPTLIESRLKWAETRFQWSPRGTYLATFHERGIALWAGENFKQYMRFSHQGVQFIDFSPCENYLVTCNPQLAGVNDQALVIWCVRTGQICRNFSCERNLNISWPFFKWNHDDSYFARLANDTLLVYETKTFSLLNKQTIKIPRIQDFEWSPTNNYISYWVAEGQNVLAKVVLMEIPTKNEIRSKNLVNVMTCKMYWQSSGDYICVRVDRYKKQNVVKDDEQTNQIRYSGIYHNFEIFRIREKQIPVDSIEIKEAFQSFAWEPNGHKFCMVYGEGSTNKTISFYRIVNATPTSPGKLELIKELKAKSVHQIFWSPLGQHCVIAQTASKTYGATCLAEFYDVGTNDVQILSKTEQDHMSDIEWDPTGRFLITYVSYWNFRQENAYMLWNFQGKQLLRVPQDRLFKFSWRPRPISQLTSEQIKEIRKNLKQYSDKFNEIDRKYFSRVSKELLDKRRGQMDDFISFKRETARRLNAQKEKRLELRRGIDTDTLTSARDEVEYTVQFLVDSKKEEIGLAEDDE